ncbi:MAG TPA: hypothetical protein VGE01_10390 [Fimbriimonas sp.]
MSVAAIPKTAGSRPPTLPPIHTNFDPSPDDSREPIHKVIQESVQRLVKLVDHTPDEHLEPMLGLLIQRKGWIENELAALRLLERPSLPPAISDFLTLEPYGGSEDRLVRHYQRLSNVLDEAICHVRARLWVLNQDVFTSER